MTTHFEYSEPHNHPCRGVRSAWNRWIAIEAEKRQTALDGMRTPPERTPFKFDMSGRLSQVNCKFCHQFLAKTPQLWNKLRSADVAEGGGSARG